MIKSFTHKGLEKFFLNGSLAGIQAIHAKRLRLILALLDKALHVEDMDAPALRLTAIKLRKKPVVPPWIGGTQCHGWQVCAPLYR